MASRIALLARLGALLVLAGLAGACRAPRGEHTLAAEKPGWGRGFSQAERELTVRAVPAAATPSVPVTRTGKPGWGRTPW